MIFRQQHFLQHAEQKMDGDHPVGDGELRAHPSSKQDGESTAHHGAPQLDVQQQAGSKNKTRTDSNSNGERRRQFLLFLLNPEADPRPTPR